MLQSVLENPAQHFTDAYNACKPDPSRKKILMSIASNIVQEYKKNQRVHLNFICTHNSRRSQLAQVWAHFAAEYFEIPFIKSFSGGTAVTAFFRNTVKTLQEAGFKIQLLEFSHKNPVYAINYRKSKQSIIGFSKLYNHPDNLSPYIAITTCSSADENCPFIPDALKRFHLPFTDPKTFDGTKLQAEKYLEANLKIAGEIHYIFKLVKDKL